MAILNSSRIFSAALYALCFSAWVSLSGQAGDPLLFPVDNFSIKAVSVKTISGEKEVRYRSYEHIPYVAKPFDTDYQSMNVSVPVTIDNEEIDATNTPILFSIGVGGYMSVRNTGGSDTRRGNPGSSIHDLALAAGFVVVTSGCRGRDNQAADGTYYGKAPAAILDLKAAVRYIRYNDASMPGNAEWVVSNGCSAGGPYRRCSELQGILHYLKNISRSLVPPMRVTGSWEFPASVPSPTWSTPIWPMNGLHGPTRKPHLHLKIMLAMWGG